MDASEDRRLFGHSDFDFARIPSKDWKWTGCPVRGCEEPLRRETIGKKRKSEVKICLRHGMRLHSGTFVYWDPDAPKSAPLRNLVVRRDLATRFLDKGSGKAESHRLGYEMSEDALTWNVFVGLKEEGKLAKAVEVLCGAKPSREPDLYLWGLRVDDSTSRPERFGPLQKVRELLEDEKWRYATEPDVMLVVPGELLVSVEAKFGSPNSLTKRAQDTRSEKPTTIEGLVDRYLQEKAGAAVAVINKDRLSHPLHGQLFRNIVFASEMAHRAQIADWRVVNLVGAKLWEDGRGKETAEAAAYEDPTPQIIDYLREAHRHRFAFATWEQLYAGVLKGVPGIAQYMQQKSAHFQPAFGL
jgi:hypothetical protein